MSRCTIVLLALFSLLGCGEPTSAAPAPDWANLCGRHCAGAPVQVAVGGHHACLRYAGGAMLCWGEVRGRRDDVSPLLVTSEVDEPALTHDDIGRATSLVPGMLDVTDMACGKSFSCAVKGDGSLWCWGLLNRFSSPGVARPADDARVPQPLPGVDDAITMIGQGDEAVAATTRVDDMLAIGDSSVSRTPASEWPHAVVTAVAYSSRGSGLIADGHVYTLCLELGNFWLYPECGLGGEVDDPYFPAVVLPALDLNDAVDLASWEFTRCALRATGEVWCWGDAQVIWYQTDHADGTRQRGTNRPTRVEALRDIMALKAGSQSFCALRADHQLLCWGVDTTGILHTDHADGERWQPYAVPDASDVVAFDLDDQSACVIRESGEVACTAQLPPDAPRQGHHRGDLVTIPNLPNLPVDFADEPMMVPEAPLDSDGGV